MTCVGVRVRPVGFRSGTEAELAAMHVVESEIACERHVDAHPQPLESYVAFARNLPSQFDDHTWLAETDNGTPVGCSACWSNAAGDTRVMECYVYVRRSWRRQGVGWRLAEAMLDEVARERRSSLIWSTYDVIPAGDAFCRRIGGVVARVNRTSELRLDDIDWDMVQSWIDERPSRAAGYRLDFWEGRFPPEMTDDAVTFQNILQATAPRDELDVGDIVLDAPFIEELDRALVAAGRQRWTIFVRDEDGRCVGGTEVTFEPWDPALALQQNTAIDPRHRGRGLAKWAKASMLVRLREQCPDVTRIRTGNAFSNAPMLAINTALGFEVVEVRTEWQGDVSRLRSAMRSER
jgi:GNAT superfamily N-acetyltransferase